MRTHNLVTMHLVTPLSTQAAPRRCRRPPPQLPGGTGARGRLRLREEISERGSDLAYRGFEGLRPNSAQTRLGALTRCRKARPCIDNPYPGLGQTSSSLAGGPGPSSNTGRGSRRGTPSGSRRTIRLAWTTESAPRSPRHGGCGSAALPRSGLPCAGGVTWMDKLANVP